MKRLALSILAIFTTIFSYATTYYVATNGNDNNNGTSLNTPFATWQKGINEAYPGDTIFVRGGVYYLYGNDPWVEVNPLRWPVGQGRTGTKENPICFWAYPPDYESGNHPILDCHNAYETAGTSFSCFSLNAVEYWYIKGITVRNAYQRGNANRRPQGFGATFTANLKFENCTAYNISARGFYYNSGAWNTWDAEYTNPENPPPAYWDSDTTYFINCDAYDIRDSINCSSGDGWKCGNYFGNVLIFEGCRAWHYSDDGFDPSGAGRRIFKNCWAMSTHKYAALCDGNVEGNGFKTGAVGTDQDGHYPPGYHFAEITNCFAAHCIGAGFANNMELGRDNNAVYLNNTAYDTWMGFYDLPLMPQGVTARGTVMHNNISYICSHYLYQQVAIYRPAVYTESHNTWIASQDPEDWIGYSMNPNYNVTAADFISLDSSQVRLPRKPDGSLPDITFLKLAPGSELIDGGTPVGLPYRGSAPDLGYAEYDSPVMGVIGALNKTVVVGSYIASVGLNASGTVSNGGPIIADHTVVDKYNDIPQIWIDEVKKMWVSIAGESHSEAYRDGAQLLENQNSKFAVSIREYGTPEAYTTNNLRLSRATWGDVSTPSGWVYSYGEEDWYKSTTAINRTKAGLDYCHNTGPNLAVLGLGWCWDTEEGADDMATYNSVTQEYEDYCRNNGYLTKIIFTTGPVDADNSYGSAGWNKYLAYEAIRNYVAQDPNRVLFDYADILCYDDNGTGPNTAIYNGNTFPIITQANVSPEQTGHISNTGALRLAKALWWMLARIAGWDGN